MDFYNHTRLLIANESWDYGNLKVMLYDTDYVFDATETDMSAVAAQQVSGFGWASGGPAIASAAVSTISTNQAMLDAPNISVTASGGAIGPAKGMVVYDATGANAAAWKPLWNYTFPSPLTAADGAPFVVEWSGNGIARWLQPA